ncbi:hypothetical protein G4923_06385 [Aeromonas rivipollensis]|uniref:Secreted protein n=1 Tax=Aeromonas rivipollensis TaxID=948519 RepID=A0ABX0CWK2_9GAMM|nr:hypothetical protein [Aeromonas rivipollensis]NEX88339.1 hypothetical protein [Aeromonas rivipollensis]NEY06058.1 hypothetical protein [Aeromonas rivipollensis]
MSLFSTTFYMARQLGTTLRLQVRLAMLAGMRAWVGPSRSAIAMKNRSCPVSNPRNDRAAQRQRAATKRRNKAKRG